MNADGAGPRKSPGVFPKNLPLTLHWQGLQAMSGAAKSTGINPIAPHLPRPSA